MGTLHEPHALLTRAVHISPESGNRRSVLYRDPLEWQRQTLISGVPKQVAEDVGCSLPWIWRLSRGQFPPNVYLAFDLARVQQDWTFLCGLAERAGALLHIPAPRLDKRPVILLLADLALSFGRFFELTEKLQRGEQLSDEEQQDLEREGEAAKERIDAIIARSRKKRQEQEGEQ